MRQPKLVLSVRQDHFKTQRFADDGVTLNCDLGSSEDGQIIWVLPISAYFRKGARLETTQIIKKQDLVKTYSLNVIKANPFGMPVV